MDIMHNNTVLHYVLREYEKSLYCDEYKSTRIVIDDESIEHISPQTENGEGIASGYEVSDDGLCSEGLQNNYLNKIGNLMLISMSYNSRIELNQFRDKLNSYKTHHVQRQQIIIESYGQADSMGNPVCGKFSIDSRQTKILAFSLRRRKFVDNDQHIGYWGGE